MFITVNKLWLHPLAIRRSNRYTGSMWVFGDLRVEEYCIKTALWTVSACSTLSGHTADLTFLAMISVARIFAGITENLIFFFTRDNSASLKPILTGTMGIDTHQSP